MFVDDLGIGCVGDMDLVFEVADDLGALLGMVFKAAKDTRSVR